MYLIQRWIVILTWLCFWASNQSGRILDEIGWKRKINNDCHQLQFISLCSLFKALSIGYLCPLTSLTSQFYPKWIKWPAEYCKPLWHCFQISFLQLWLWLWEWHGQNLIRIWPIKIFPCQDEWVPQDDHNNNELF